MSPGLELAAGFYAEVVGHLVRVPHAAALLGEGSDVLGYDDARSADHAWGPRLIIFVDHEEVGLVRRAIDAGLPQAYRGHQVRFFAWQDRTVRRHVEVVTVADWLREQLGALPDKLQPAHWLGLPQQRLLQVTAGAVFHDDAGQLSEARRALAWYPRDVWLWLMASQWRIIADQEPLPGRTSEAGDQRGTRLALTNLARSAMQLCFLQERRYWPYTKWFSMAFSELDAAQELGADLDRLLGSSNPAQGIAALVTVLEHLAGRQNNLQIAHALDPRCRPFEVGINQAVRPYLVLNAARFAQACAEQIGDSRLRRLPTVGGIDQLTHAGDLLVNFTSWPTALIKVYEQQLNITGESS